MRPVRNGDLVCVSTADGATLNRRAITGPIDGDDFRVIWVCKEQDYTTDRNDLKPVSAMAWPVEAVALVT